MKNYCELRGKAEKDAFILNYEIIKGNIIVHYASHREDVIPYTRDAELEILKQMKAQVREYGNHKSRIKAFMAFFFATAIAPACVAVGFPVPINIIGCLIAIFSMKTFFHLNTEKEDLEKNQFFLEQEELLNQYETDIKKLSDKTKEQYEQAKAKAEQQCPSVRMIEGDTLAPTEMHVPTFNINSIEKISYNELKQLIDSITKDEKVYLEMLKRFTEDMKKIRDIKKNEEIEKELEKKWEAKERAIRNYFNIMQELEGPCDRRPYVLVYSDSVKGRRSEFIDSL